MLLSHLLPSTSASVFYLSAKGSSNFATWEVAQPHAHVFNWLLTLQLWRFYAESLYMAKSSKNFHVSPDCIKSLTHLFFAKSLWEYTILPLSQRRLDLWLLKIWPVSRVKNWKHTGLLCWHLTFEPLIYCECYGKQWGTKVEVYCTWANIIVLPLTPWRAFFFISISTFFLRI